MVDKLVFSNKDARFGISPDQKLTLTSPIVGQCEIHGELKECVELQLNLPLDGKYCIICFAEWIAKTFPKLK